MAASNPELAAAVKHWRRWVSDRARKIDKARTGWGRGYASWLKLRQDRNASAVELVSERDIPEVHALALELQQAIADAGPAFPVRVTVESDFGTVTTTDDVETFSILPRGLR